MDVIKIKNELLIQKKEKFKGNLYHYTQINFSYNSNRIEGSRLTEEQTEAIFNNNTLPTSKDNLLNLDDIIESKNHFKLFDYLLDNLDKDLTKDMILEMHKILKNNTSNEESVFHSVGKFKKHPNIIGTINVIETTNPQNVEEEINKLLNEYNNIKNITINDIIDFHFKFELIHPFSDGNGRIGRIIMFKECLKNNLIPFIISDENKEYYLRGLKNYKNDKLFLIDTCKHAQDIYEYVCNLLIEDI